MNERIKELADRAQAYADQQWLEAGYPSWENYQEVFAEDYNKKFAELIVQKCADIGQQYADGNYEVYNQILEHFGIEEE